MVFDSITQSIDCITRLISRARPLINRVMPLMNWLMLLIISRLIEFVTQGILGRGLSVSPSAVFRPLAYESWIFWTRRFIFFSQMIFSNQMINLLHTDESSSPHRWFFFFKQWMSTNGFVDPIAFHQVDMSHDCSSWPNSIPTRSLMCLAYHHKIPKLGFLAVSNTIYQRSPIDFPANFLGSLHTIRTTTGITHKQINYVLPECSEFREFVMWTPWRRCAWEAREVARP